MNIFSASLFTYVEWENSDSKYTPKILCLEQAYIYLGVKSGAGKVVREELIRNS